MTGVDAAVALYCGKSQTVREVANELQWKWRRTYMALRDAGVTRTSGMMFAMATAPWIGRALQLRAAGVPVTTIARRIEQPERTVGNTLERHATTTWPWVHAARSRHALGISWAKIAAELDKDREDVQCFVSRLVGYERGLQEIANELDRETMPPQRSQAAQATPAQ